jgi:hypothetical protein
MAKIRVKKTAQSKQAVQQIEAEQTEAVTSELPATAQQDEAPTTEAAVEQLKAEMAATPAKPAETTVVVTLPFKGQTSAFLEVLIGDKQAWLAKPSLVKHEVAGDEVTVEMTRAFARRRGLLAA